jgi:mevalonate kinase
MSKAHGKFILIGEHSVVYGHPAIAIPLEEAMITIDVLTYLEDVIESEFYSGRISELPESFLSIQTLYFKLKKDLSVETLKVIIHNQTIIGAGLGASATFAAALTKAMYKHANIILDEEALLEYIDLAENISHGKASGIDARASISNQPFIYENGMIKPFNINIDAYVLVVYSNIIGHTKKAVSKVKHMVDHHEGIFHVEALKDNTNKAIDAIKQKRIHQLGHILNDSQRILKKLGVSHPTIDELVEIAIEHGAYGAKLTGGGLGGCVLVLANERVVNTLKKTYEDQGYKKSFTTYLGDKS